MSKRIVVTKSFQWEEQNLPQLYLLIHYNPENSESFSESMSKWLHSLIIDKNLPTSTPSTITPTENSSPKPLSETKHEFLGSPAVQAYMKQKAIQKAKTEGMIDRAKAKEELRRQFEADRLEREYFDWKKRQEEKERTRKPRPTQINFPNSGIGDFPKNWS